MIKMNGLMTDENSFVEIILKCYRECTKDSNQVPDLYVLSDYILEYTFDYGIFNVSYKGIRTSLVQALDTMLEDVLKLEGILYRKRGQLVNSYQLIMFLDLE